MTADGFRALSVGPWALGVAADCRLPTADFFLVRRPSSVLRQPSLVMQQRPAPIRRQVNVRESVVIVVAHRAPEELALQTIETGFLRRIREVALAVALIKGRIRADEEDVEVPVAVVIEERAAVADGLKYVQGPLAGYLPLVGKAGRFRHVGEASGVRGFRSRFPLCVCAADLARFWRKTRE